MTGGPVLPQPGYGRERGAFPCQGKPVEEQRCQACRASQRREEGVKPLPFAQIRSGFPVLSRPGNKKRAVALTKKQFRYGFGNALSERESGELFDKWAIPGPGKPLFEASAANFKKSSPAAVDTRKLDRGPLLIVTGGKDHTVPEVVARAAYKLYSGSGAVTDYHAFPDRGHSLVFDYGWREVANLTQSWLASQDL